MRRLVGSIRLSADTDTTNSPRMQKKDITAWVAEHPGNIIVRWVEDRDVSGGDPIRDRGEIHEIFADDYLGEWDGIIGSRTDRLFRDDLDYLLWVRDVGDKYGKFVVDAEDGVDSSTETGSDILNDRVRQARKERQRIARNRGRAQKEIRQDGRYGGGPIPFGLMKERYLLGIGDDGKEDFAYRLVVCGPPYGYANEARSFIERIISGETANSVASDLNKRGIPTSQDAQRILDGRRPREAKWTAANLLRYLRSPALKGYVLNYPKKGEPRRPPTIVRGADGLPVRRAAIIDDDKWDELQEAIRGVGQGGTTGRRANVSTLLLGIAHCGLCGGRLHSETKLIHVGQPGRLHYYGCQNNHYRGCKARLIPRDELDERVNYAMMDVWSDHEIIEVKRSHGDSRERQLKEIGQAIIDLTTDRYARGIIRPNYNELLAGLQEREAEVRSSPPPPSVEDEKPTGETIGETYDRLDLAGRRSLMQQTGFTFRVLRDPGGQLQFSDVTFSKGAKLRIILPEEITL